MSLHSELLRRLQDLAHVDLVASLRDPRIKFGSPDDLRVFLPDLHLMTNKSRPHYAYWINHEALLVSVLSSIAEMKSSLHGKRIILYQMGDCLDVWRETPFENERNDAAARIKDDHGDLVEVLFGERLRTAHLLGNHDFDLYRFPAYSDWELNYFVTDAMTQQQRILVVHGDQFQASLRGTSEEFKHWFNFVFDRVDPKHDYDLGKMKEVIHGMHGDYRTQICGTAAVGTLRRLDDEGIPDRWNVRSNGVEAHEYLLSSREFCRGLDAEHSTRLTVACIGHTHRARLAVHEGPGDDFFALVDTGAWIENCVGDPGGVPAPSCQLTAIGANEIRIYQLAPR